MSQRILLGLLLASALLLAGCERAKTKLDREVDRLCAIDGGVRIYETVKLARANFGDDQKPSVKFKQDLLNGGRKGFPYESSVEVKVLVDGNPGLQRNRILVTRVADGKLLGERINYRRSGGDFVGPWEPSRYECPSISKVADPIDVIFVQGE